MMEDLPDWQLMQASHDVGFERVIRHTRKTLLVMEPWSDPRPPTRVWCLYESYISLQQPGGQLTVALGREQRRTMQMALQRKFSAIEAMIARLDARNADVTVESDRTNIFGAIENLEGGFDGLNGSLRRALREWLAENATQLLERTDPARPRMTAEELQAEREEHGAFVMRVTQLMDWWPGFHELLLLIALIMVAFACGVVFPLIESERVDWDELTHVYLLLAAILIVHTASKLEEHQGKHQLRRVALFSGATRMQWLHCVGGCLPNYGFAAVIFASLWLFGSLGFGFGMAIFMVAAGVFSFVTSGPIDILNRHLLMEKAAWLYLHCGKLDMALRYFETAASVFESTLGASHPATLASSAGNVQALHMCDRHEEATAIASRCLEQIDRALRCPRYAIGQCCFSTGGYVCLWMSRLGEPLGAVTRCDFLHLRAAVLAADGRPDADVLSVLGAAVSHGFMPSEQKEAVKSTVGDEAPRRFAQDCPAFAAITERSDAEFSDTGTPTQLEILEERMNQNYKNRWRLKCMYKIAGLCGFVGILVMAASLILRAEQLHLNGAECSSIDGLYLGLSGCRAGRYCADDYHCTACPVSPVEEECDAVDGEDGCCTAAFLRNCPANPFNCTTDF